MMTRTLSARRRILAVFVGGLLGALARALLSTWLQARWGNGWPVDILLINLTGAWLLACSTALADATLLIGPTRRLAINVGFIGAYTTFSSFALGDLMLLVKGQWWHSGGYFLLSMVGGMAATMLGDLVGQRWVTIWRRTMVLKTTRTLTETLTAFPPDEMRQNGHLDIQDDLLVPEEEKKRERRKSH